MQADESAIQDTLNEMATLKQALGDLDIDGKWAQHYGKKDSKHKYNQLLEEKLKSLSALYEAVEEKRDDHAGSLNSLDVVYDWILHGVTQVKREVVLRQEIMSRSS